MDPPVFSRTSLERICDAIAAEGWVALEGFVSGSIVGALREQMRRREAAGEFHTAAIGHGARRVERPDIRGDRIAWLDEAALSPPERTLWDGFELLRLAVNRTTLLGLFSLEAHYAIYPPDAAYRRHRDAFIGDDARVLSWVLYLNDGWSAEEGGALRIHLSTTEARDVLPVAGTLACFLSERFEHEVLAAKRQRLSLTGWFRRRGSGAGGTLSA